MIVHNNRKLIYDVITWYYLFSSFYYDLRNYTVFTARVLYYRVMLLNPYLNYKYPSTRVSINYTQNIYLLTIL